MKSVEQILHDCYVNGVRIDPEPYHQYLESGSTEPKTLRQMESLISYAAGTGRVHPSFGRHYPKSNRIHDLFNFPYKSRNPCCPCL